MRAIGIVAIVLGLLELAAAVTYPQTIGRLGAISTGQEFASAHADWWAARDQARQAVIRVTGEDPRSGASSEVVASTAREQYGRASRPVAIRLGVGGVFAVALGVGLLAVASPGGRLSSFRWLGDWRWMLPATVILAAYFYATIALDMKADHPVAWLEISRTLGDHWQTWWDLPGFYEHANRELATIIFQSPSDWGNEMFREPRIHLYDRVWTAGTVVTTLNLVLHLGVVAALWYARRRARLVPA